MKVLKVIKRILNGLELNMIGFQMGLMTAVQLTSCEMSVLKPTMIIGACIFTALVIGEIVIDFAIDKKEKVGA